MLLLSAALLAAASGRASELASVLPEEVPARYVLETWEKVVGHVDTGEEQVSYALYIRPGLNGLYALTHYRIDHSTLRADGSRALEAGTEKLLWNARPGREPIHCYERVDGEWRALTPGSEPYRTEMFTAIHVYSLHRQSLLGSSH